MGAFDELTSTPFSESTQPSTPTTPTSGGAFADITSKPFVPPATSTATTSPYYQGTTPSGAFLGISDKVDPYSGRPLFAYRLPGVDSTTTDMTRTAPMTNPEVAAPTSKTDFENPRMPESASQSVRKDLGATPEEQLDHRMALALGGANTAENLKLIPTAENQAAGKSEEELTQEVANGKLSLFQAQRQEAQAKGLPVPFTDQELQNQSGFWQKFLQGGEAAGHAMLQVAATIPNGLEKIKEYFTGPAASPMANWTQNINKNFDLQSAQDSQIQNETQNALPEPADVESQQRSLKENGTGVPLSQPITVKYPFSADQGTQLPDNLGGQTAKSIVEFPETFVKTLREGFAALSGKQVPDDKGVYPIQSDPQEVFNSLHNQVVAQGGSENYADWTATIGAMSAGILNLTPLESVLRGGVKAIAAGAIPTTEEQIAAHALLGSPSTLEEAKRAQLQALHLIGGHEGANQSAISAVNSAYQTLERTGIPSQSVMQKGARFAQTLIQPIKFSDIPDMMKGKAPQGFQWANPDRQLPGWRSLTPNAPKFGLQIEPVERVGGEVSTSHSVLNELAQGQKSSSDFRMALSPDELKRVQAATGIDDPTAAAEKFYSDAKLTAEAKKYPSAEKFVKDVNVSNARNKLQTAQDGKPITVTLYHGTPDGRFLEEFDPTKKGYFENAPDVIPDNTRFKQMYGKTNAGFKLGQGVYDGISFTDDARVAESYSKKPAYDSDNSVPMVAQRIVILQKPKVIDVAKKEWDMSLEKTIEQAKSEGYDGIILKNVKDNYHPWTTKNPSNNVIVFSESQIKTKSQLTDLWNKAHEPTPKETPPEKVRTTKSDPAKPEAPIATPATAKRFQDLQQMRALYEEQLDLHPARGLMKYVSHETGQLPEVTGKLTRQGPDGKEIPNSKFGRHGDDLITELGYHSPEEAKKGIDAYKKLRDDITAIKDEMRTLRPQMRMMRLNEILQRSARSFPKDLPVENFQTKGDPAITEKNGGVEPPENRGGMRAPEIDWTQGKDKAALRLSTDTMERNLEKIFPAKTADELNKFLVEPVRENETARVAWVTDLRNRMKTDIVDNLGIKPRSKESELLQQFGEGRISLDELKKTSPTKWQNIVSAKDYFRREYDTLLDQWNRARGEAGLKPVPKLENYFRHFVELNDYVSQFGFDFSDSKLPTAISGITEYFRSQTPWAGAALRRLGSTFTDDAVTGMDNYLDTTSRAIFHTDSVQRGRLIEQYLRDAASGNRDIVLPNFASNLNDWVNLVSGKQARLDRAVESVLGRPALSALKTITRRFGANVIGGNISAAVTHMIPLEYTLATTDKGAFFRGAIDTLRSPFLEDFNAVDGVKSSFLTRRFGKDQIYPSLTERGASVLGKPFHMVDQFISRTTIAAKYLENLQSGMSKTEAMRGADNYAARVIGDRSTGNLPNLMNTKTLGMLTQFMIEVNDNLHVLAHDIPRWEQHNAPRVAYRFIQLALYSWAFNQTMQYIKGSGKGLDPIDMGLTLAGMNDEGHDKSVTDRLLAVGNDLMKELPFTSLPTGGQIPALVPLQTAAGQLGKGQFLQAGEGLASSFLSPIGGGQQLQKSIGGIEAWRQGYVTDANGNITAKVDPTLFNLIQGGLFGKNAFESVKKSKQEISNLADTIKAAQAQNKSRDQQAKAIWTQLQDMPPDTIKEQLSQIAASDPDMAKKVLSAAKDQAVGMTEQDNLLKSLGVNNGQRAAYIANKIKDMQTDEKKAYLTDLANKKILTSAVLGQVVKLMQ